VYFLIIWNPRERIPRDFHGVSEHKNIKYLFGDRRLAALSYTSFRFLAACCEELQFISKCTKFLGYLIHNCNNPKIIPKMKKIAFLTLAAAIVLAACQPKPAAIDVNAEADTLRNLENQWTAAILAKDIDKIYGYYAPDAVSMPDNKPIFIGRDSIRRVLVSVLSDTTTIAESYSATIETVEVAASGDLAYVRGSERFSKKTPNGPVENVRKWIDIWKKIEGQWKCIVSIANSDKPLGGQ
jgi:ketosteroid isomerase-like protein